MFFRQLNQEKRAQVFGHVFDNAFDSPFGLVSLKEQQIFVDWNGVSNAPNCFGILDFV